MNQIAKTEAQAFSLQFKRIEGQIRAALPPHVSYEKFERVCMLAVQKDPKLLQTDQRTLFLECQKAAADGLMPDGREGVLVRRWNSQLGKEAATWQPMVAGLLKLARNSGQLSSIHADIVYKGEKFVIMLGDEPRIEHERNIELMDEAEAIGVYAVAKLKSGELQRDFLSAKQVLKIRDINKQWAKGPWGGPFAEEMWKKSAIRRLYKRLPSSTDKDTDDDRRLQQAIERVDEVVDGFSMEVPDQQIGTESTARDGGKLGAIEGQIAGEDRAPPDWIDAELADGPAADQPSTEESKPDADRERATALIQEFQRAKNSRELSATRNTAIKTWLARMQDERPELVEELKAAFEQREADFAPP